MMVRGKILVTPITGSIGYVPLKYTINSTIVRNIYTYIDRERKPPNILLSKYPSYKCYVGEIFNSNGRRNIFSHIGSSGKSFSKPLHPRKIIQLLFYLP